MFDTKVIKILKRDKDNMHIDDNGIVYYDWNEIGSYMCDVQPISSEKCRMIFGDFPRVKYQIWLEQPIEDFNDDTIQDFKVFYNDKYYIIESLILWNDDWFCYNFAISNEIVGVNNE